MTRWAKHFPELGLPTSYPVLLVLGARTLQNEATCHQELSTTTAPTASAVSTSTGREEDTDVKLFYEDAQVADRHEDGTQPHPSQKTNAWIMACDCFQPHRHKKSNRLKIAIVQKQKKMMRKGWRRRFSQEDGGWTSRRRVAPSPARGYAGGITSSKSTTDQCQPSGTAGGVMGTASAGALHPSSEQGGVRVSNGALHTVPEHRVLREESRPSTFTPKPGASRDVSHTHGLEACCVTPGCPQHRPERACAGACPGDTQCHHPGRRRSSQIRPPDLHSSIRKKSRTGGSSSSREDEHLGLWVHRTPKKCTHQKQS